jgi:hypothetical protein
MPDTNTTIILCVVIPVCFIIWCLFCCKCTICECGHITFDDNNETYTDMENNTTHTNMKSNKKLNKNGNVKLIIST